MLKSVIVGYGGISRAHKPGYERLEKEGKVKLVGAYDIDPEAFVVNKKLNIALEPSEFDKSLHFYTDLYEMLEKEKPDFVDICAPTYVHKELAIKILEAGYNVLSEKPMALTAADGEEMIAAAKKNGKHLMIAQCVRFGNDIQYVKKIIEDGRYGKPMAALCTRTSLTPTWGYEQWFSDRERSGGCLTDMHIHDIDLLRYLFGEPSAVSSRVAYVKPHESVHTSLFYDGISATAIGEWATSSVSFSRGYRITFERAVIILGDDLKIYPEDGEPFVPEDYVPADVYRAEISYFCDVVSGKTENLIAPPEDTVKTMRLIEAMRKSADESGKIIDF